jgi:hypothetical protein
MNATTYINREISWLEFNQRLFAIVMQSPIRFSANLVCFLSRLNDRRRVATGNAGAMFLPMARYLIQSYASCYLPQKV